MFQRPLQIALATTTFLLLTPLGLLAQAIPSRDSGSRLVPWEPPVRAAQEILPASVSASSRGGPAQRRELRSEELRSEERRGEERRGESVRQEFLQVDYLEPIDATPVGDGQAVMGGVSRPMPHSHQLLRAPRMVMPGQSQSLHVPQFEPDTRTNPVHPLPHLIHHHSSRPAAAVIPDAVHREVWKSPFSYGYFGARGERKWMRHFGYRDRDTEWRLR